jgi:hypothetical protein
VQEGDDIPISKWLEAKSAMDKKNAKFITLG